MAKNRIRARIARELLVMRAMCDDGGLLTSECRATPCAEPSAGPRASGGDEPREPDRGRSTPIGDTPPKD